MKPPNSGHLLITGKTRRCPLFRGFTVMTMIAIIIIIMIIIIIIIILKNPLF